MKSPAQIEDCKAAVRWLRANAPKYGLDPNRFAAMGSSAGGHLAAMLGTTRDFPDFEVGANLDPSSAVQAVVDHFGPTDFLQMDVPVTFYTVKGGGHGRFNDPRVADLTREFLATHLKPRP